jgi:pyruvate/2-oxoglutarate dehydrogenase complex dihydrolipoamide dehydrogenase (E3) component
VSRQFDAIIIGTGQAGPSLAARFADAGMSVAIIERHKVGGTCVNTGCIPTKTLVASAYAAHVARRGAEYGFAINGDVRVDMKRVKARKDEVSGRSNRGVEEWLRGLKNSTVVQGHARFHSPRTVVVNDEVVHVLLDVMYAKAPYTVVQRAMHIHPTVAEFLPTVLSKLEPFT